MWPETAIVPSILYQYYNGTDSARKKYVSELLEYFNNSLPSFLVGNFHHEINNGKAVDYNSAMFFTRGKNVIPPNPEKYYKIHLVPISEDFPFLDKFPHLEEKLNSLGF